MVKSHIFPRALMIDLRGEDSYVHEVVDDQSGTRFLQNGPWDRAILCEVHERITSKPDDYAVKFCRNVIKKIKQDGEDGLIDNPEPALLARFVCQSIWRFAACNAGRGLSSLGPYENQLREIVFSGANCTIPFLVARNHLLAPNGSEATLALAPFPSRLGDVRIWLFGVSGLHFYVKLDQRPFPANGQEFMAHNSPSIRLFQLPPKMAHDVPILQKILSNMGLR